VIDWPLGQAVRVLHAGGLVVHATEGVWGIACDPFDGEAVRRVLELKGRSVTKGLILIGADPEMFAPELSSVGVSARAAILESWPGRVTWVLPSDRFPRWIGGGRPTVAVRVPAHPQARALSAAFGAVLVSTSANQAGHPPARDALQARRVATRFTRKLKGARGGTSAVYVLPGRTLGAAGPSEIRTPEGERLRAAI
jgi:L-threonylcarbamoyladenylate synthase